MGYKSSLVIEVIYIYIYPPTKAGRVEGPPTCTPPDAKRPFPGVGFRGLEV